MPNRKPSLVHSIQDYHTIADLEHDDSLILCSDYEARHIKDEFGEQYMAELEVYSGLFVQIRNGVVVRIYGYNGSIPSLEKVVTRLKTVEELVDEIAQRL